MNKILFLIFINFYVNSDIINILHISDIHYDQLYNVGSPNNCEFGTKIGTLCCHKYNIPLDPFQPAKKFGDFNCDTPYDLIKETFKWINKSNIGINAIFWGGDTVNHHDFIQSPISNLKIIRNITNEIKNYFPNSILIPVIGNHDLYPIDQFSSEFEISQYMLIELFKIWNINNEKDFLKYGFYSTNFYNIKLIILNSIIWDKNNIIKEDKDSIIQFQWLNNELNNTNKKIWIIGHIPPTSHQSTNFFYI